MSWVDVSPIISSESQYRAIPRFSLRSLAGTFLVLADHYAVSQQRLDFYITVV